MLRINSKSTLCEILHLFCPKSMSPFGVRKPPRVKVEVKHTAPIRFANLSQCYLNNAIHWTCHLMKFVFHDCYLQLIFVLAIVYWYILLMYFCQSRIVHCKNCNVAYNLIRAISPLAYSWRTGLVIKIQREYSLNFLFERQNKTKKWWWWWWKR